MRTLATTFASLGLAVAALGGLASPAAAQAPRVVDVVEVKGLVDDIVVDYLTKAVAAAERSSSEALILQVDSTGGVTNPARIDRLTDRIRTSRVPVVAWIGGSGRPRAYGQAFTLVSSTALIGVSPGSRLGQGPGRASAANLGNRTMGRAEALRSKVADLDAPTLGDLIVSLDGRLVAGERLDTADVVQRGGQPRREPNVQARFSKLPLMARLLHAVTNPWVAYLLLMAALLLFVFELYTAGIGVAGVTGAMSFVLAAHGLAALPTRTSSLILIGVGVLGYTIDLQAGAPRTWTVLGTAALAVGSVRLYDGLAVPLPALAAVLAGTALAMVAGMPAMLRTRFSTPTIGRASMIGQLGVATSEVAPEGTIELAGAPWPARTNRATPIAAGDAVRVVAIDGLLLEVEPESGGARDYRR